VDRKVESAGGKLATLIHPTAYISPTATIAPGTVILPRAVVNTGTTIEKGCIINLGAIVDHDCIIEEGVHLCLGCIVKGENRVERLSKIEAGEVIPARQWPVNKA
jgi:UDP-N-acetylbacillosamine N-acetyltransferase